MLNFKQRFLGSLMIALGVRINRWGKKTAALGLDIYAEGIHTKFSRVYFK
jgi:hypothetical protein